VTYCLAIKTNSGIVFCSDSRTNAGVDQVSTYSKMYSLSLPDERQLTIMSAGNLATTQAVLAQVRKDLQQSADTSLMTVASVRDAAEYLGQLNRNEVEKHDSEDGKYEATFILGGQIGKYPPEILLVYPQGNFISTSDDTPFLQIGESKYGKPILDRVLTPETGLATAASAALVSMDSTMRSNITVGPPIEITLYKSNSLQQGFHYKFEQNSEYLRELNSQWDQKIREAFTQLPPVKWANAWDQSLDEQNSVS